MQVWLQPQNGSNHPKNPVGDLQGAQFLRSRDRGGGGIMNLEFATITYRAIRDRIRAQDPQIDEQTLADTVEGLTELHEILTAIIRAALADQALAAGLEGRIAEMQARLDRLQDRAAKRRQIAKDVMVELDLKKITAPDFTVSIRPGMPSLLVLDETAVPSIYWEPREPRLNRQKLADRIKGR